MAPAVLPSRRGTRRLGRSLFAVAIFASAFLIFLVQPMVGKRILPWFGGAPAVWALCLAFYQVTLFFGYAYAHVLVRFIGPSRQLAVHALVFGGALLALPVLPATTSAPEAASEPSASILSVLARSVALPFLALAATGPLVQAWFARRYPARSPYPLYAVSNAGSLLALICYPILIEPRLSLSLTGDLWSWAFAMTAFVVLSCAALARRQADRAPSGATPLVGGLLSRPLDLALWCLLSGSAVALLMGVTNTLCLDLASVPFLWVLPLGVYLTSFILCFGSERVYRTAPYLSIAAFAFAVCYGKSYWAPWLPEPLVPMGDSAVVLISSYCLLLFATCMLMHGELYRLRPPARSLTIFYLWVSGGGALGGLFVGLAAPLLFDNYYELPLGLGLAQLLLLVASWHAPGGWLRRGAPRWRWTLVAPASVALLAISGKRIFEESDGLLLEERSFFGVVRVLRAGNGPNEQWQLHNGSTLHGLQFQQPPFRKAPSTYYGMATGIGALLLQGDPQIPRRVGVVGLGAGTLAAYGRPGDLFRFYEIDPVVIRLAGDGGPFTFLSDSEAEIEIVPGDARLSLAAEQARGVVQDFDLLVIDAFSSDSIPVHLLTREAFAIYVDSLAETGLLAFHLSNRHFELKPLVLLLGGSAGMDGLRIESRQLPQLRSMRALWVFLGRDPARLESLGTFALSRSKRLEYPPPQVELWRGVRTSSETELWTDDYSDLFGVLKLQLALRSR